mgnify:CR=1 FL=1
MCKREREVREKTCGEWRMYVVFEVVRVEKCEVLSMFVEFEK